MQIPVDTSFGKSAGRFRSARSVLRLCSLVVLIAVAGHAQTGQIAGKVIDPGGAVVPDVKVQITEAATNAVRETVTNNDGYFTSPNLLPGSYSIHLEHPGFRPLNQAGIQLQVNQDLRLDFTLEVGSVNEEITVTAAPPMLEAESTTIGQVVQSQQISNLPLLGRNTYALATLVPGVRPTAGVNQLPVDIITTGSVSINGAPGTANSYLIDGAPNTAPAQNQPIINLNPDVVQEFKVETNNISAEYGRAAGGVFNVVTKSGTNSLHGDLYEYFRNSVLNANDFFANRAGRPVQRLDFNQFGGAVGGPVVLPKLYNGRNKTFFFVNTELVRYVQSVTYTATVPNPTLLTGNFSNDANSAGQKITIYDPATTVQNGTGYLRSAFAGNVIPTNRISPVAARMASYWPAPNVANAPPGAVNYINTGSNYIQKNTFSTRLDHNLTDNTRMFLRYSYDESPFARASPYGASNQGSPAFGPQDFTRYNAIAEVDHVFSPSLIGVVRASWARLTNFRDPLNTGFDISQLGLPSNLQAQIGPPAAFPTVTMTGYGVSSSLSNNSGTSTLGSTGRIALAMDTYSLDSSFTKTLAKHEIKFGAQLLLVRYNTFQTGDTSTNFTFTSAFTQGPNPLQASATAGDALATFLLGIPGGSVTPSAALSMQTVDYGLFVQDRWRVTSKLAINAGLRWEYETPKTDRYNQFANFNTAATPPLTAPGLALHGALSFVGVNGVSRYQSNPDRNNFAPRLGFAWQMNDKTVVRSSAGIFFADVWGIGSAPNSYGVSGFASVTNVITSVDNVHPIVNFSNPFPQGLNLPTGSTLGPATLLGQSINFFDRNNATPYASQWNIDIQRQLPGSMLLDLSYVGLHALKFPANLSLNQLPDQYLSLGAQLTALVTNPFYGQIATGQLSGPTVARGQLLLPYPQFTGVTAQSSNWASSNYNGFEAKLQKRFSKGFSLLGSYTWSKLMDYTTGGFNGETLGATGSVQDWNNLAAEYSPSALDQTQRFILNVNYALPFFNTQKGLTGHLLGGWELGLIGSFYSGSPIGVTAAVNGTNSFGGNQRPNWNGVNAQLSDPTVSRWFNTSVFSQPAAFQFGNAPRTFNSVRGDVTHNLDLSLIKDTALTERWKLQFRAEAFNLLNTPVFAPPGAVFGSATFGVVSAMQNQPRVLQFAMKLLF